MLGASSGQKPETMLNILQCTEQPLTAKIYLAQNVNSTKVRKPWSTSRTFDKGKPSTKHQKLGLARGGQMGPQDFRKAPNKSHQSNRYLLSHYTLSLVPGPGQGQSRIPFLSEGLSALPCIQAPSRILAEE